MYCRPAQDVHVTAFRTDGDKIVLRIEIDRASRRPVVVLESDGSRRAYYRVRDENILAPELMVRAWIASADSGEGMLLSLSSAEQCLIDMLDEGPVAVEDYMKSARISRATAEDTVVSPPLHAATRFPLRRQVIPHRQAAGRVNSINIKSLDNTKRPRILTNPGPQSDVQNLCSV